MDFKNQEDKQEDKIVVQCAVCGRVRSVISDWSKEIHKENIKLAKVICPLCSPKPPKPKEK